MAAGMSANWWENDELGRGSRSPISPTAPIRSFGSPSTFAAAANTQASDYDNIMKQYRDFVSSGAGVTTPTNVTPQIVTPTQAPYQQSQDVTRSLGTLGELSTTGGYDERGKADLRARGIAPTRSIYANAQQNVERQKALAGGYSPNYNATQAELARDESSQISDINTNVNAGIAQSVAGNRIAAASPYASASGSANAEKAAADARNAAIVNQINEANAARRTATDTGNVDRNFQASLYGRGNILSGIQGQANLYGTTPALTNTFGNQVVQASQLGQGQQQLNNQKQQNVLGFASRFG